MKYNKYGQTGIEVSAIGFGGMRFKDQENVDECASLVQAAYDRGITYFDTAPGYGKSEELFGVAFKDMLKARKERPFYVSTKTMKSDGESVRKDLETSLERMGLDYIDFYHVWCVMSLDAFEGRKKGGAIAEFEKLKEEGLVKNICLSTHMSGPDIATALRDYPFEGVLCGYSAMNFAYRDEGLQGAADLNRGVVVMNPLGGGVIPQHPDKFSFVKTQADESVVEGALRFLINDPRITVSLVGLSTEDQLDEAIRAVDGFEPISDADITRMRGNLNESFDEMCTSCRYCDKCASELALPQLMDSYNQYMLDTDKKPESLINRLRWHWGIDVNKLDVEVCTECGVCMSECTQKLPITDRLKKIGEIVAEWKAKQ